jgi:hypothetical protein
VNDDSPAPQKARKAFQKRRKNEVCKEWNSDVCNNLPML